jgi:Zn finger protein HypA/HybF involved in hydrogenase expression
LARRNAETLGRCSDTAERTVMAAHAGEKAQKTGDFHCAKCHEKVHVQQGHKIPKCPNGHSEFETRTKEPGNKSS